MFSYVPMMELAVTRCQDLCELKDLNMRLLAINVVLTHPRSTLESLKWLVALSYCGAETTVINLLRYFRNCTTHRYLISLHKKGGWYNENTSKFKAIDGVMYEPPWNPLRVEVPWISVPEITHLKDGNNTQNESLRFYEHPLVLFVISICSFVVLQ